MNAQDWLTQESINNRRKKVRGLELQWCMSKGSRNYGIKTGSLWEVVSSQIGWNCVESCRIVFYVKRLLTIVSKIRSLNDSHIMTVPDN